MKDRVQSGHKQRLELLRTCDLLSRGPAQLLKSEDLSATQYNVLRILRGSPNGLPCGAIASRMITRDPDITRLLDRLDKRGLISRWRELKDRRMVMLRITASASSSWPASMIRSRKSTASNWVTWEGLDSGRSLKLLDAARVKVS